jgi:hypothetical protein
VDTDLMGEPGSVGEAQGFHPFGDGQAIEDIFHFSPR